MLAQSPISRDAHQPFRRGFTLVELLVVIAIIGILASIALVVAGKVTQGGRERLTQDVIRVLDTTLTEYLATHEGKVPSMYTDDQNNQFPLLDGRWDDSATPPRNISQQNAPAEPSLALYLLIASDDPAIDGTLKGIDAKLTSRGAIVSQAPSERSPMKNNNPIQGLTIKDGYGNPIRFVHPAYDGGFGKYWWKNGNAWQQNTGAGAHGTRKALTISLRVNGAQAGVDYRRSYRPFNPNALPIDSYSPMVPQPTVQDPAGDADEGLCQAGRPYFYSAGADGDPGTRDDNIYTTRPTFPAETADQK